jgi:hypothetical protein
MNVDLIEPNAFISDFFSTFFGGSTDVVLQLLFSISFTIVVLLYIILFSKLLGGKATRKEVLVSLVLSGIPSYVVALVALPYNDFEEYTLVMFIYSAVAIWCLILHIIALAYVQKFSKLKASIVVLTLYFAIAIFYLLIILSPYVPLLDKSKTTVEQQIEIIDALIEDNLSNGSAIVAGFASVGYEDFIDTPSKFKAYNEQIITRMHTDVWQRNNHIMQTNLWVDIASKKHLTHETFSPFFNQLETLDNDVGERNSTLWKSFAKELPDVYIEYMEKQLNTLSDSNVTVDEVELFTIDGTVLHDSNASRAYLLSQQFVRLSEFCDDAKHIYCDAEVYAKRATEISGLNPNAFFYYAYLSDDAHLNVERLERGLQLIWVSDELLTNQVAALYNNYGYAILQSEQKAKYNEAITYLKKAYHLESSYVMSLASISTMYQEQNKIEDAYNTLAYETYKLFRLSDDELLDTDNYYEIFFRHVISTSYTFKDYNTTEYLCNRYLKLKESDYEECHTYLKEIQVLQKYPIPTHSFWHLYTNPKTYLKTYTHNVSQKFVTHITTKEDTNRSLEQNLTSFQFERFLEKNNYITRIDWKGEHDEHQLRDFIQHRLKKLHITNFSWDFYNTFYSQYDFSNIEQGDYIIDLFELLAFKLDKVDVVLGNIQNYSDSYSPFITTKEQYQKIGELKTEDWKVEKFDFPYNYTMTSKLKQVKEVK